MPAEADDGRLVEWMPICCCPAGDNGLGGAVIVALRGGIGGGCGEGEWVILMEGDWKMITFVNAKKPVGIVVVVFVRRPYSP
jgi:hypothetical protein